MRILIATGLYPPEIGGPATYTAMLEKNLPEHGCKLVVLPYGAVRHHLRFLRHLIYTWKLIKEARTCDVIYALDPVSVGLPVYLAHLLSRTPYMLRIAGDYAWEQGQQRFGVTDTLDRFLVEGKRYPFFVRLLRSIERMVAEHAAAIVVPSRYMKSVVASWGVNKEQIYPIYSALYPITVEEPREEIRKMFHYEGTVLVTAGRLVPWKGMRTLIEIMPALQEKIGKTTLVVIGDGPLEAELRRTVVQQELIDKVRFVGRLPRESLGTALKGADIFVLNSSYEGLSHQLLEAMDLGVPVVTTSVGGNVELIKDGITGVLVPYDNKEELVSAISRVATHDEFRTQLIQHARVRAKDFSEEKVVGELASLIERIFGQKETNDHGA